MKNIRPLCRVGMAARLASLIFSFLLASLCEGKAQPPYIHVQGSLEGGQIGYTAGHPNVTVVDENFDIPDVSLEAQNMSPLIYNGSLLDGSYLVSVDLLSAKLRVSARAPGYAFAYTTAFAFIEQAGRGGNGSAIASFDADTITVYGPFSANSTVSFAIRAHLQGTMQGGSANQGWQGMQYVQSNYPVLAHAGVQFDIPTLTVPNWFAHISPATGEPAGGSIEIIDQTLEYAVNAYAQDEGHVTLVGGWWAHLGAYAENGAVADITASLEIILPRGCTYTSQLGLKMPVTYVNAAPSFTDGGNVAVPPNAGSQAISNWATDISAGPADEAGQTVSFLVTDNSNPGLFVAGPAVEPNGTLTFTPAPNVIGRAQVAVVLRDNGGTTLGGVDTSVPHTFTITVSGPNHPPLASAQSVTTIENTPVVITLTGADQDLDPLSYSVLTGPTHGLLSGTAPNVTYTPAPNYIGPDSFSFVANDGTANSSPATVSITMSPGNSEPLAADDAYTTDEDTVLRITSPGLLANDGDPDRGMFSQFRFRGHMVTSDADFNAGEEFVGYYSVNPTVVGVHSVDASLQLQYDSISAAWELQFPSSGREFQGDMTDVDVGNDVPPWLTDRYIATLLNLAATSSSLPSGKRLAFAQFDLVDRVSVSSGADFLQDDSIQSSTVSIDLADDVSGRLFFTDGSQSYLTLDALTGPLSITAVNGQAAEVNNAITLTSGATLRVQSNGSFSYDPTTRIVPLPAGTLATETFAYEVSDPDGGRATATATITVTGVNDLPQANGQAVTTVEDVAVGIILVGSDVDGDALTYTVLTSPAHGILSGTAPNLTYTPHFSFNGLDGFTFRANDGIADSASATVTITVTPVNDAPFANATGVLTYEDTAVAVPLSGFDIEAGGYALLKGVAGLDGERPAGRLLRGSDGLIYGTAGSGGSQTYGTIFRLSPDGSGFSVVHDFTSSSSDGRYPYGSMVEDAEGVLFGTTAGGGHQGQGTVFKVQRDGTGFAVIYNFHQNPNDGINPQSELLLGSDGRLYGTAYAGGANQVGVLFRIERTGDNFTVLHSFGSGGADGRYASAGPIMGSDGHLYGTTRYSSTDLGGTVYKVLPDGSAYEVLHTFASDGSEGSQLLSGVVEGPDGAIYGTAWHGGLADFGVVYKLNKDGSEFSVLHRFGGLGDGIRPYAGLLPMSDGWLYGTTADGGGLGGGLIYRIGAAADSYSVLWSFHSTGMDGRILQSPLIQGPGDIIYGTTSSGGPADKGTIFRLLTQTADLGFTLVGGPSHGTLSGTPPHLVYTPLPNYNGSDSFTFKVNDGTADSAQLGTVFITVLPANDTPIANAQGVTTQESTAASILLTGSDVDDDELTFSVVASPVHGTLNGTPPNVSYTPAPNYSGPDSFSFVANDGTVNSSPATVAIYVLGPPTIASLSPASMTNYAPSFTLTVNGDNFDPGTAVYWNGYRRPTSYLDVGQVTAEIPYSDLDVTGDFVIALVTVTNSTGASSSPVAFTIIGSGVSDVVDQVNSSVALAGETASAEATPSAPDSAGVTASLENNAGTLPATVTAASYTEDPTATPVFEAGGGFVDLKVSGADPGDRLVSSFYYPKTVTGAAEMALRLRFFNGTTWIQPLSSGGVMPVQEMQDDLDGTVSGGRFQVMFDDTSIPKITELNGTMFALAIPDTTPPTVICQNITVRAGLSPLTSVNYPAPGLNDNIDPAPQASYSIPSGSGFLAGITVVTCTAFDAAGNTATASFTVTVVDDTKPVIAGMPANITVQTGPGRTTCDQVATWTLPSASDNCAVKSFTSDHNSRDAFPVGTTIVTYTAEDAAGNTAKASFTVTVVDDTKPVIVGIPANITVQTGLGRTTCDQVATWTLPTASDNCVLMSLTSTHAPGATFPVGTTIVTYTAKDSAGNTTTASFTVKVVDDTKPAITISDMVVVSDRAACAVGDHDDDDWEHHQKEGRHRDEREDHSRCKDNHHDGDKGGHGYFCQYWNRCRATAVALTQPVVADNCGIASVVNDHPSTTYPLGDTVVTWTATDTSGNTRTAVQKVTVVASVEIEFDAPVVRKPTGNTIKRGQVVPFKVDLVSCLGNGVTTGVTVKLKVQGIDEANGQVFEEVVEDANGLGADGTLTSDGLMILKGDDWKFNLDTSNFGDPNTIAGRRYYRATVMVIDNATLAVVGMGTVNLETKLK